MSMKSELEDLLREHKAKNPSAWTYPAKWGVEGYNGTGSIAIVSFKPSSDLKFESRQAKSFYEALLSYRLSDAHLMDVLSSESGYQRKDEAEFFLGQLEIVSPRVLLVMDMTRRDHLWKSPMPYVHDYLKDHSSSFEVYTIYHYTKLAWGESWVQKWHARFSDMVDRATASLTPPE